MSLSLDSFETQRWGVKGPRAAAWLQEQQVTLPLEPNTWSLLDDDPHGLILRLGASEFFLEERLAHGTRCQTLAAELVEAVPGVYPIVREDVSLLLAGVGAHQVLAEAGSCDFSAFATTPRQVVMTLLLGVTVIVIAPGNAAAPCFRIWCDPTYGSGLYAALSRIAAEENVLCNSL